MSIVTPTRPRRIESLNQPSHLAAAARYGFPELSEALEVAGPYPVLPLEGLHLNLARSLGKLSKFADLGDW